MAHHEVRTAVNGELVLSDLPDFRAADGRIVRAARIVAISLSGVLGAGETRLALAGGRCVDVPKPWLLQHHPVVGAWYVQTGSNSAEIVDEGAFELTYESVEAGPSPEVPGAAENQVQTPATEGTVNAPAEAEPAE